MGTKRAVGLAWAFAALLAAVPAGGQTEPCRTQSIIVSVLDAEGFPLRGLEASNFQGELRGKPVRVRSVSFEAQPRQIVVLLDGSEDMREEKAGKWAMAQAIVEHIFENGPRGVEYTFALAGLPEKTPLRGIPEDRLFYQRFNALMLGIPMATHNVRRAPIFDVISGGLSLFEKIEPGDVIFLVTDGGEQGSKSKSGDIQRELVQRGVRLFAVTLPMRYQRQVAVIRSNSGDTDYDEVGEATDFLQTARISGGGILRVLPKRGSSEWSFKFDDEQRSMVATALQRLYVQMTQFYRLELEFDRPVDRATSWKLSVSPPAGQTKKSIRVVQPERMFPCNQGQP